MNDKIVLSDSIMQVMGKLVWMSMLNQLNPVLVSL